MIKGYVGSSEKDIKKVPMLINGVDKGWEIRDQQGELLWYGIKTITGVDSLTYKGYGIPLISWEINGNGDFGEGTPSKNNIITPQWVGDPAGNLFDPDRTDGIIDNAYINKNTHEQATLKTYYISYPIPVIPGQDYTWVFNNDDGQDHSSPTVGFYDDTGIFIGNATHSNQIKRFSFTIPSGCAYIRASVYKPLKSEAMLYLGTSSGPSGYIIPITVDDNVYNVQRGYQLKKIENTTDVIKTSDNGGTICTQKIVEIIFTGNENWTQVSGVWWLSTITDYLKIPAITAFCSHYPAQANVASTADVEEGKMCFGTNGSLMRIFIKDSSFTTTTDWKYYLKTQNDAGTPVTVWYILAEPLIVYLPTTKLKTGVGQHMVSIDTTTKPSSIKMTGHIKNTDVGYILTDSDGFIVQDSDNYIITVEE